MFIKHKSGVNNMSNNNLNKALSYLGVYVKRNNYCGYDLFDGLNSRTFKTTPLYNSSFIRLCFIQFFKRCPINLRKIFLVPKGFNAKGGALFLLSACKMFVKTGEPKHQETASELFDLIKKSAIQRQKGCAWGYNFDWQAKAFYVPE